MATQLERRARGAKWIFRLLLLCFVASAGAIAWDFTRFWKVSEYYAAQARQGFSLVTAPVIPDEAIVVLTGDTRRIPKALELLRHRASPFLIISGTGKNTTLTDLVNQQGDATVNIHSIWKKIILESRSGSTIENAQDSEKILISHRVRRVILVTSEYHMLRALRIFRILVPDMEYVAYPVLSTVSEISLLPPAGSVEAIFKIWFEYWKYVVFRLVAINQIQPSQK